MNLKELNFPKTLRIAAAAAALVGLGGPAAAEAPAAPSPALWKLADADTTIYLFGTIHLLPKGTNWRTDAVDKALAASDEVVTEMKLDDMAGAAQVLMTLGMSGGLPPLLERVPEEKRAALRTLVEESGVPMAVYDQVETWAAGLMLTAVTFKQLGLDPELGVETQLKKASDGKPLSGLETAEQQLGFFDQMGEETQREFLLSVLEDPEEARREFAKMLAAWSKGDVDGIAESFSADIMSAEMRTQLLTKRNRNWAEWLSQRLDRPGTVFMAVGAGHLAGEDSVQAMLKAKGLDAKRIQ